MGRWGLDQARAKVEQQADKVGNQQGCGRCQGKGWLCPGSGTVPSASTAGPCQGHVAGSAGGSAGGRAGSGRGLSAGARRGSRGGGRARAGAGLRPSSRWQLPPPAPGQLQLPPAPGRRCPLSGAARGAAGLGPGAAAIRDSPCPSGAARGAGTKRGGRGPLRAGQEGARRSCPRPRAGGSSSPGALLPSRLRPCGPARAPGDRLMRWGPGSCAPRGGPAKPRASPRAPAAALGLRFSCGEPQPSTAPREESGAEPWVGESQLRPQKWLRCRDRPARRVQGAAARGGGRGGGRAAL